MSTLTLSGLSLVSDDGFEFISIKPDLSDTVFRYQVIDRRLNQNIRSVDLKLTGNWTHVLKSRAGVRCNMINNSGVYNLLNFDGTVLKIAASFTSNNIPAQHQNQTNLSSSLRYSFLSEDCKILSIDGLTYSMSPVPFTKLNSVTTSPKNISLAVNGDLLYVVSGGFLYKHKISTDSLVTSVELDYRISPLDDNLFNNIQLFKTVYSIYSY